MSARPDISATFARLARELADCEAAGLRIEAAVGDLVPPGGAGAAPGARAALQELDSLVQRLRDMAAFAAILGARPAIAQGDLADALAVLKLARVRAALSGAEPAPDDTEREAFF